MLYTSIYCNNNAAVHEARYGEYKGCLRRYGIKMRGIEGDAPDSAKI